MSGTSGAIGVGFVGAGMATQSIHLTTLATSGRFAVAHVMDPDLALAHSVASRSGARATSTIEELLDDPTVEVVAVCSPDRFHADHVVAACEAGKRAVLCEKPLATSMADAERIRAAAERTGVPVIVGTMHAFDPAYRAARDEWQREAGRPELMRSVIWLPSVAQQVAWSTEHEASGYVSFVPDAPRDTVTAAADLMRTTVLDLAVHNIALLRDFVDGIDRVDFARARQPFGYVMSMARGDTVVQFIAMMWGRWAPQWTLDVWGGAAALRVEFPPSYVTAGSATAEFSDGSSRRRWSFATNGYQAQWEHVADVVEGVSAAEPVDRAIADIALAVSVAEQAERQVLGVAA